MGRRTEHGLAAVVMLVVCGFVAASPPSMGDYADEIQHTMRALLDGDLGVLASGGHLMGPLSIIVRLPAVAIADALGGDALDLYRAGNFVLLLPAAALGLYLRAHVLARGVGQIPAAVLALLCVANPPITRALKFGHPEEPFTAALCIGAVLAAQRGRNGAAVLLIAGGVLSKQWAILAVPVVLVAAGDQWRRVAATTVAVGALALAPIVAADPGTFARTIDRLAAVSNSGARGWGAVLPQNVWWPVATPRPTQIFDGVETVTVRPRYLEGVLERVPRPLMGLVVLGLCVAVARRSPRDAVALLGAVFLVRCLLDPADGFYYHVPFVMAVATWDATLARRMPTAALLAACLLWVSAERIAPLREFALTNAFYLAWALPFLAWLVVRAMRPQSPAPS